jgi:hypothetical protein
VVKFLCLFIKEFVHKDTTKRGIADENYSITDRERK